MRQESAIFPALLVVVLTANAGFAWEDRGPSDPLEWPKGPQDHEGPETAINMDGRAGGPNHKVQVQLKELEEGDDKKPESDAANNKMSELDLSRVARDGEQALRHLADLLYHEKDGRQVLDPSMFVNVFFESIQDIFESEEAMQKVVDFIVRLMYEDDEVMSLIRRTLSQIHGLSILSAPKDSVLGYARRLVSALWHHNPEVIDQMRTFFRSDDFLRMVTKEWPEKQDLLQFGQQLLHDDIYGRGLKRGVETVADTMLPKIERLAADRKAGSDGYAVQDAET